MEYFYVCKAHIPEELSNQYLKGVARIGGLYTILTKDYISVESARQREIGLGS